ncbi:hypothetical protein [Caenimonas sp. SL110]|uniref:hypothetical protein n=1 Tax=Caenimonas sp. SL110 TaxID=1450524 RepID=UPI000654A1FA|nr:hypothetical protein [Caenimonas sp. SL110]
MKYTPKAMIQGARDAGWSQLIEENPVTGNLRLSASPNDVMAVIEILGGSGKAEGILGVEEVEIQHWIDDHYVPTRYVEKILTVLPRWSRWSLQTPPFDPQASVGAWTV